MERRELLLEDVDRISSAAGRSNENDCYGLLKAVLDTFVCLETLIDF